MMTQYISKYFKTIIVALATAVTMTLSSCGGSGDDPKPVDPDAVSRTVLVYMAANNNLGSEGYDALDLDEMDLAVKENSLHGGRLLVFHAPYRSEQKLLEITPEGRKELKTYDRSQTSVSAERMSEVLSDIKRLAPAEDYGLVFWSHGSGWIESINSRSGELSTLDWGLDGSRWMKVTTLADVIKKSGTNPSFIYFDACLMGTIEVVYQLRDCTKEIIASGTELQVTGMRYDLNIPVFFAKNRDLTQAAKNTFNHYNSLQPPYNACAISYIVTSALPELATATRNIMVTGATVPSNYKPVPYSLDMNGYYIYDLPHYMKAMNASAGVITAWEGAFKKAVPYFAHTEKYGSLDISGYRGLGTYIITKPSDINKSGYTNYDWWADVVSKNPTLNPAN